MQFKAVSIGDVFVYRRGLLAHADAQHVRNIYHRQKKKKPLSNSCANAFKGTILPFQG
jgi:hypothetical protein